ncbi:MAG: Fe-S protein assembly co-chaperone HscB [Polyangiaceae bacterium]
MDPFRLLGIEPRFDVNLGEIEKTHRELSRTLHPDRYVGAGASERREALSRAADVNEAWRVVRDPVRRAEALFALAGIRTGDTHEPKPDQALLFDMLEKREALAEAKAGKDRDRVERLGDAMRADEKKVLGALAVGFASAAGDTSALEPLLAKLGELRYMRRFLDEVGAIVDQLDEDALGADADARKDVPS